MCGRVRIMSEGCCEMAGRSALRRPDELRSRASRVIAREPLGRKDVQYRIRSRRMPGLLPRCGAILCLLAASWPRAAAATQGRPAEDLEESAGLSAAYQFSPRWALVGFGEMHLANGPPAQPDERVSGRISYSPWRWLTLGTGYLYRQADPTTSGLDHEHRLYAEATLRTSFPFGLQLRDRVRPEQRWLYSPYGTKLAQRYRNRLMVEWAVSTGRGQLMAYLAWEKFYVTSGYAWQKTRYSAGVTVRITRRTGMEVFYVREENPRSRPFHRNIMGLDFILSLRGARANRHGD